MRVKRGVTTHAKHKKLRAQTKGYSLVRRSSVKQARQAVIKALSYQYRDRRNKKRDFRALWITRINAALGDELSYSAFMGRLKRAGVTIDRKMLSELAVSQPKAFEAVIKTAKATK
jgi:large subunit ribosomal protein L20